MKILISGAFGFVASNLSKSFNRSIHDLFALDIKRFENQTFDKFYSWNEYEKIDWSVIDVIIHLAGKAHDTRNTSSEKDYFEINVGLTKKIFNSFLISSATKFIFFSSVKAVVDSMTGDRIYEAEIPNPKTPYGKSKLEAERYILRKLGNWRIDVCTNERQHNYTKEDEIMRMGNEEKEDYTTGRLYNEMTFRQSENPREAGCLEKKVYILRPCMIHGPGNKGNLNLLYKLSRKGLPWPLGSFENSRSFCSIQNISFIVQQIIERNIEPGIYNIADDEALPTNELIRLIAKSLNKEERIWKIPQGPIRGLARMGDFLPLPLNSERLKKLTESYVVSNVKIKKALGIEKMPVTAKEGFSKTFESFRK